MCVNFYVKVSNIIPIPFVPSYTINILTHKKCLVKKWLNLLMIIVVFFYIAKCFLIPLVITFQPKNKPDCKNTQNRCNNTPHILSFLAICKWGTAQPLLRSGG